MASRRTSPPFHSPGDFRDPDLPEIKGDSLSPGDANERSRAGPLPRFYLAESHSASSASCFFVFLPPRVRCDSPCTSGEQVGRTRSDVYPSETRVERRPVDAKKVEYLAREGLVARLHEVCHTYIHRLFRLAVVGGTERRRRLTGTTDTREERV